MIEQEILIRPHLKWELTGPIEQIEMPSSLKSLVQNRLDEKMTAAFHSVHSMSSSRGVHNRLGAYLVAVERVAEAAKLRGWV